MKLHLSTRVRGEANPGLLLIALAGIMWGTVGVATRGLYTVSDTNPLSIGFWRLVISIPALLLACWYAIGPRMFRITRRDGMLMALLGMMMALYQVCYFASIARVGVTIAVLVTLCTAPVLVALLSAGLLGERPTRRTIGALAGALVGTGLLVGVPSAGVGGQSQTVVGVLFALGSALGYAVITLCSRSLAGRYHPLQPITIGFAAGALLLLPFALLTGLTVHYPVTGWALLLHLGLVPTALAYWLFLKGMRTTTATAASITTLVEPLTSSLLATLFFGEHLGPLGLVGALLLLGAMMLLFGAGQRGEA